MSSALIAPPSLFDPNTNSRYVDGPPPPYSSRESLHSTGYQSQVNSPDKLRHQLNSRDESDVNGNRERFYKAANNTKKFYSVSQNYIDCLVRKSNTASCPFNSQSSLYSPTAQEKRYQLINRENRQYFNHDSSSPCASPAHKTYALVSCQSQMNNSPSNKSECTRFSTLPNRRNCNSFRHIEKLTQQQCEELKNNFTMSNTNSSSITAFTGQLKKRQELIRPIPHKPKADSDEDFLNRSNYYCNELNRSVSMRCSSQFIHRSPSIYDDRIPNFCHLSTGSQCKPITNESFNYASKTYSNLVDLEALLGEREAEILLLRNIMDKNERAIMQVNEEKRTYWLKEMDDLKVFYERKIEAISQRARKAEQRLQLQLFKVKKDHNELKEKLNVKELIPPLNSDDIINIEENLKTYSKYSDKNEKNSEKSYLLSLQEKLQCALKELGCKSKENLYLKTELNLYQDLLVNPQPGFTPVDLCTENVTDNSSLCEEHTDNVCRTQNNSLNSCPELLCSEQSNNTNCCLNGCQRLGSIREDIVSAAENSETLNDSNNYFKSIKDIGKSLDDNDSSVNHGHNSNMKMLQNGLVQKSSEIITDHSYTRQCKSSAIVKNKSLHLNNNKDEISKSETSLNNDGDMVNFLRAELSKQKENHELQEQAWLDEKNKVLQYQKKLQLNYLQILHRNRYLEAEVGQLSLELENREIKLQEVTGDESLC